MNYNPDDKVYQADDHIYSINDLLRSALDPEYVANGMPRISDFHIKVGQTVRFRLDDDLQAIPNGAIVTQEIAERLIYPLLSEKHVKKMKEDVLVDVDAGYELVEDQYSFRINAFRDRDGIAATIRLLPKHVPDVSEVGFPTEGLAEELVHLKRGLVLVTGITGSGKSTTIASLINAINRQRPVRIITLEDPIEYMFDSEASLISQREVGEHVDSFSRGLFSALRENPDVVYVGEMRDIETASLALTAAETGHLVFSTLHTRDCVGAITRIIDMYPPEREKEITTQLSFSMDYVISQKLVPRIHGDGRLVAMEVMRNSTGISNLLRTGKWHQLYSIMETKSGEGMITMEQCLLDLYEQGYISREDAILYANRDEIVGRLPPPDMGKKKKRR
ncbi:PilT/PilU family type 4a pilus ATPase [Rubellicoccus peritrichatus]|uniref:PilT/PilU family type 4a pilus ATPase n=1 Tax=Rubellicoccus peritrichatus TaxID=3080537 RepID=A0AAQ3LF45_9BACT|nr:PilT/PilU family type 4a pilus ATPase [Puniceicoccus sp. CR14]WOO40774.1 PilT/PilU family type 4a pilus ATPase [Puniceicoccus sp. CR14]